jgi:uncharacterized protein (UPF0332 family)
MRMDERFERCLREKRLVKAKPDVDLIQKEIAAAEADLKSAHDSAIDKDYKWATVQAYYSMFHTAKALVLSKGYREKGHMCLSLALKALFIDEGVMEEKHYTHYRDAMVLREDADYGLIYSENSSKGAIGWAQDFLDEGKKLLK